MSNESPQKPHWLGKVSSRDDLPKVGTIRGTLRYVESTKSVYSYLDDAWLELTFSEDNELSPTELETL
jgi:hypothetical protein